VVVAYFDCQHHQPALQAVLEVREEVSLATEVMMAAVVALEAAVVMVASAAPVTATAVTVVTVVVEAGTELRGKQSSNRSDCNVKPCSLNSQRFL